MFASKNCPCGRRGKKNGIQYGEISSPSQSSFWMSRNAPLKRKFVLWGEGGERCVTSKKETAAKETRKNNAQLKFKLNQILNVFQILL